MNRTDRLLAIVLELQGKRKRRAHDLAATFETSKRTIYRDVQALCEAGVPIISTPGQGYSLMEGYFLPPLRFSIDEATMLLLGSDVMAQNFDAEYRGAARSAARKIAGVLPSATQDQVEELRDSIRFVSTGADNPVEGERLQQLRGAIIRSQTVRFRYHARHSNEAPTESSELRQADPYSLIHVMGTWMVMAFCHARQDMRVFRLSRMDQLVVLERPFNRSAGSARWRQAMADHGRDAQQQGLTVRVLFDQESARWIEEDRLFYITAKQNVQDGLLVTLSVRHERDILQWLLGWGRHAQILEPDSLRDLLAAEAEAILINCRQTREKSESLLT